MSIMKRRSFGHLVVEHDGMHWRLVNGVLYRTVPYTDGSPSAWIHVNRFSLDDDALEAQVNAVMEKLYSAANANAREPNTQAALEREAEHHVTGEGS